MNLIYIEFHWKFPITYLGFWLVSILLQKFDTNFNLKKNVKMIRKTFFFWWKLNTAKEYMSAYPSSFFFWENSNWQRIVKKKQSKEMKKKIQSVSIHFCPTIKLRKKQRLMCQLLGFVLFQANSDSV